MRRMFIAIASAALLSVVTSPAVAAASSMSGEVFAGATNDQQTQVTNCDATTVAIHFGSLNQPATGPYPGFYSESGNIVLTNGVITGWSASWSVAATATAGASPYVSGTKTLQTAGGGVVVCAAGVASTTTALTATLAYSADAGAGAPPAGTSAFVGPDAGTATISLAFNTTAKTGTFTETFGVTAPPTGCDVAGHHHNNDECKDAGHDHHKPEHHKPGGR
jgi:hypothetical protein